MLARSSSQALSAFVLVGNCSTVPIFSFRLTPPSRNLKTQTSGPAFRFSRYRLPFWYRLLLIAQSPFEFEQAGESGLTNVARAMRIVHWHDSANISRRGRRECGHGETFA